MEEQEISQEKQVKEQDRPQTQEQPQQQTSSVSYSSTIVGVVVAAFFVIAFLVGWYFYSVKEVEQITEGGEVTTGLGAELFEDIDNLIEGKVPTIETTSNPIENFYKNPFE